MDFFIEDAQGKVLVLSEHIHADTLAERSQRVVEAVEGDLIALGERLSVIKQQLREKQGPDAAKLQRERQGLAQLATFLHATKAHARGRRHVGQSLSEQATWLEAHAHLAQSDGVAMRTAKVTRDAWQAVIEAGHEITVNGRCSHEPLPPELGDGGYRTITTCRVLRGSEEAPILITGIGAISPARNHRLHDAGTHGGSHLARSRARPSKDGSVPLTARAGVVGAAIAFALAAFAALWSSR